MSRVMGFVMKKRATLAYSYRYMWGAEASIKEQLRDIETILYSWYISTVLLVLWLFSVRRECYYTIKQNIIYNYNN